MRGRKVSLALAAMLALWSAGAASAQETRTFGASALLRVRIPFGPNAEERSKTVSLVSAAGMKTQIDLGQPLPEPQYRLVEAGLDFNGDAFVNVASSQVMRAVRTSGVAASRQPRKASPLRLSR